MVTRDVLSQGRGDTCLLLLLALSKAGWFHHVAGRAQGTSHFPACRWPLWEREVLVGHTGRGTSSPISTLCHYGHLCWAWCL